jgi:hypothetical protein
MALPSIPREVSMPRQRWLLLSGIEVLEELWEQFPESSRRQAIELYARLIARAAGLPRPESAQKEGKHESLTDGSARQDPS